MAKEILIADSERTDQEEFQKYFETTDYHPVFSDSGEEAFLRVKLFKPDLIIGGRDLCEAIKTDQELQDIPFILLSDILEETIRRSPCDAVVIATPTDLRRKIRIDQPTVRVSYDFDIDLNPLIEWFVDNKL